MARERSIAVRLRAEVDSFVSAMGRAGRALGQVGDTGEKTSRQQQSAMSRLAQHARENEQAWTSVGRSLMVVGGAITAFGGALLGTGIQYNALRQKATQALTAVTGSTEEAAEQMRRLDEYGQNSWLMRDTLIRAQQTMTGFGIETSKVIPYMDALAEATAATGGSNQDFEEMALLMGQIQSQGKITATELMRFGKRGVDAAQLIGDAMGMTAGEIRESITAGTLDAQTALDALAQGMKDRYNGASDLVRNTFQGAVDDVAAAFRDLGAELATPLVNPEGGGLLVDWLNRLADAMRAFRDAPNWLKYGVAGLGALAGAGTLLGGSAMVLIPRLVDLYDNLGRLGRAGETAQRGLRSAGRALPSLARAGTIAIGVGALALGALKLADALGDSGIPANAGRLKASLLGIGDANIDQAFLDATAGAYDLNGAMERLMNPAFGYEWGMNMAETLNITSNSALNAKKTFEELDGVLAGLVQSGDTQQAAQLFALLYGEIDQTKWSTDDLRQMLPGYGDALAGLSADAQLAAEGQEVLAIGANDAAAAMEEAQEANQQLRAEIAQSVGGLVDWTGGIDAADFSLRDWTQSLEDQIEKLRNFDSNMSTVFDRVSEFAGEDAARQIADRLREMGDEGVAAADALAAASDGDLQRAIEALLGLEDQAGKTSSSLADLIAPEINVDTSVATAQLVAWQLAMAAMGVDVPVSTNTQVATTQMVAWRIGQALLSINVPVTADTTAADEEIAETTDVDPVVIDLQSDAALANEELHGFYDDAAALDPTMYLDADDADAQGVLSGFGGSAARARPIVPLGADDKSARTTTSIFTGWAGDQNPKVKVGANDSSGRTATGYFTTWVGQQNPKAKVGAKDDSARATTNDFTRWAERRKPSMGLRATSKAAKATVSDFSRWAARKTPSMALKASTAGATKTVNSWLAAQGKKSATVNIIAKTKSGFAGGGPVHGPGSGTSDSIPARLSAGEHVWTAREVAAAGGHGAIMAMRQSVLSGAVRGFAAGGAVSPTYVTTPAPVVHVAAPTPAERRGGATFHVDQIVAADPTAAAQAFSREVRYQTMGA